MELLTGWQGLLVKWGLRAAVVAGAVWFVWFKGDEYDSAETQADLVMQLCSNVKFANQIAGKTLLGRLGGVFEPKAHHQGFIFPGTRGVLGFIDGTANPASEDRPDDRRAARTARISAPRTPAMSRTTAPGTPYRAAYSLTPTGTTNSTAENATSRPSACRVRASGVITIATSASTALSAIRAPLILKKWRHPSRKSMIG